MSDAVPHRESIRAHQIIRLGDLTLTSEREGAVHSICLFGELDLATAGAVQDELTCVEASECDAIVVDLSGLTFIDSTGLRLLVGAAARSRAAGGRLSLLRGGTAVQRALQLTGLEDQLPFAD